MVLVTGSVRAGMEVAAAAAPTLKRVHLELGGKAPVIVFDDADPVVAAEGIAGAGYFNAGQDCTAATRVLAGPRCTRRCWRRSSSRPRARPSAASTTTAPTTARSTTPTSSSACRLPRRVPGARVGGDRRVPGGGPRLRFAPTVVAGLRQDDELVQSRSSAPSSPCRSSATRPRPCSGPTGWSTAWPRRCGRVTTAGPCAWRATRLRVRVDQHPHSARGRDAARRLQALRLRQGSLRLRVRGLHAIKHVMSYIEE